jgi:hypothetical protein
MGKRKMAPTCVRTPNQRPTKAFTERQVSTSIPSAGGGTEVKRETGLLIEASYPYLNPKAAAPLAERLQGWIP